MSKESEGDEQRHRDECIVLELKTKKSRAKSMFTRARNRLRDELIDDECDKERARSMLDSVEQTMDAATQSVQELASFYKTKKRTDEMIEVTKELSNFEIKYDETLTIYHLVCKMSEPKVMIDKTGTVKSKLTCDLSKQLKRVSVPVFTGVKKDYQFWISAFKACVDEADATPEYKFLQLRQYLGGEALKAIEGLGHSAEAYEAAKSRLERKFGGDRRKVNRFLEELNKFPVIKYENARMIERFADLLDITIINMKESDAHDLESNFMYLQLVKKLPESMISRFHRWLYENQITESVDNLKEWVLKEAEFHMIAMETKNGLDKQQKVERRDICNFASSSVGKIHCKLCFGEHGIWKCANFSEMPIEERWRKARDLNLCFRCLSDNHMGRNCPKKWTCKVNNCKKSHHTLLHSNVTDNQATNRPVYKPASNDQCTNTTYQQRPKVALRTVPVFLQQGRKKIKVMALLDDGSTKSYINADVAAELGLHDKMTNITVHVLNGKTETFQSMPVNICLESLNGQIRKTMELQTIRNVTGNLPVVNWNTYSNQYPHLKEIPFPYTEQRQRVDLLIGSDYPELHLSLYEVPGKPGEPIARLTPLGWTCVGCVNNVDNNTFHSFHSKYSQSTDSELSESIRQFWEIEQSGVCEKVITRNDQEVLQLTENSIQFDKTSGRYQIGIPWKSTSSETSLNSNYKMAKNRLENTEKRLTKKPKVEAQYKEVINNYVKKNYVTKVKSDQTDKRWFLPHFPVVRDDKATTKVRIVFDASAKKDGVSLNDMIEQGPSLQNDLFDVMIRFRSKSVAVMCDIQEMYLQVNIPIPDRKYFSFLWRNSCDRDPDIYEFSRLVFGVNASPFLAQFISQNHAKKFQEMYPLAAEVILRDTYMDDSMTSVKDEETGVTLYYQLSELWKRAGMHARKWLSNSSAVLEHVPVEDRLFETDLCKEALPSIKTLGMLWSAETDMFSFRFKEIDPNIKLTKRTFFSKVSTLYDPLGFITPYTIRAKMLMQELWLSGVDWDDEVCDKLGTKIWKWFQELADLDKVEIARNLNFNPESEIHTFVDASSQAYGAVVYVRNCGINNIDVNLVASKTKVAPLKSISIPRLELMAAVLGVKLTKSICRALGCHIREAVFWSDSMNVQYWIRNQSRQFKPFVANRVGEIQSQTEPQQWRYVPTKENPADLASRGQSISDLGENKLWWSGPEYLQKHTDEWPENKVHVNTDSSAKCERRVKFACSNEQTFMTCYTSEANDNKNSFRLAPERFSKWKHYTRVFAWVNRFIENCQLPLGERNLSRELLVSEIQTTENNIIKIAQVEMFGEEISCLKQGQNISRSSKLIQLNPLLDEENVLRGNSRLRFIEHLSIDSRYPVILPRKHPVTRLIVKHYHEQENHCGTNHTLASLSSRFWIVSAREAIREVENECYSCKRLKGKTAYQVMAPLPNYRAGQSMRAFNETAVDYAGPFLTKQGRGKPKNKRYLCLFTCMSCRAVHFEMAYSLETDSFLNAFFRFVSRRGFPKLVLSDNATNFVGAVRELKELQASLDKDKIERTAANKGVQWKFIPPRTPHFGGVHESMVKSAKRAVYHILANADITDEELLTAFSGAESLVNSRPLTYQSANPADDCILTPNHFLFGQVGGEFAPESVDSDRYDVRKRWRRVQELVRHFWGRWIREFLPTLSTRKKWHKERRDFAVGDIVMVIDPDTTRGSWNLGRIQQTHPGVDGHVRVATVLTGGKLMKRPIHRLCLLEAM